MSGPTKGMVAGQPIQSGTLTKEYEKGHERVFGKPDSAFPRGRRFVWNTVEKRLVPAGYVEDRKALDAPVMAGRFYENAKSPIDGSDIGSRSRHRDHMKRHNVTTADDFKGEWNKADRDREQIRKGGYDAKSRREDVARAWHQVFKT